MDPDKLYGEIVAALAAGIYTRSEEKAAREMLRKLERPPIKLKEGIIHE